MAQKFATSFYIIWKTPRYLRVLPLSTFRLCETFFEKKFSPKGPPFNVLEFFRQNGCWKIPKGPPFQFFRHCETFFQNFFPSKVPLQFFLMICDRMDEKSQCPLWCANSVQLLGFSGTVEEKTLKSFCCFWALDMAPTWAVSGLFPCIPTKPHFLEVVFTSYSQIVP